MKKIVLSCFLMAAAFKLNAQTVYSENFNTGNPFVNGWTVMDVNADGDQWQILDLTGFGTVFDSQDVVALSASSIPGQTNFSPDNLLISPVVAFTLQNGTNTLSLSFKIGSEMTTASGNYDEYLSVYIVPNGATQSDITSATPVFSGAITQGQVMQVKNADVTAFAGQSMKIAFRHHNCTDLSAIFLDDIMVEEVPPTAITLQCGPNQNLTFTANGNQLPNVTTTAQASTTCAGSVTLTQSPAAGTVMTNGANTVTITATDACSNTETCTMVVNFSNNVGIETIDLNELMVYPNPAQNELYIKNVLSVESIEIINAKGQVVKSIDQVSSEVIDLSGFERGFYMLECKTFDNKTVRTRFIKN